jgi:tetratricopeptide (TPR) repeat protein
MPPELIAGTCVSILSASNSSDQTQLQRVESWIEAAAAKQANSMPLQLSLAMLRSFQRRYDESEAIYRQVLKNDKSNLVALNNLAWLVALHDDKPEEALVLINQALNQTGLQPSMLDTRAVIHLKQGEQLEASGQMDQARQLYELAIRDLETAVSMQAEPAMYFHLARAYLKVNRQEDAKKALEDGGERGLKREGLDPFEQPQWSQVTEAAGMST